jgi:hypothetical protein
MRDGWHRRTCTLQSMLCECNRMRNSAYMLPCVSMLHSHRGGSVVGGRPSWGGQFKFRKIKASISLACARGVCPFIKWTKLLNFPRHEHSSAMRMQCAASCRPTQSVAECKACGRNCTHAARVSQCVRYQSVCENWRSDGRERHGKEDSHPISHLVPTVSDRGAPSPEMAKVSSAGATLAVSKMGVVSAVARTMKDDGARNGLPRASPTTCKLSATNNGNCDHQLCNTVDSDHCLAKTAARRHTAEAAEKACDSVTIQGRGKVAR